MTSAQITSDGPGVKAGDWIVAVSPVALEDGREMQWHPPQPVAFNLLEAKKYRDRGVRQRRRIMGNLQKRANGTLQPSDARAPIDCLSDMIAAVLFAFAAIESFANHAVQLLPDDATIVIRKGEIVDRDRLDALGVEDKLKVVVPFVANAGVVAGTAPWERFLHLKRLRNDLVHVKRRGYDPDPAIRTAYDRLMVGDGDECVEDAIAVIETAIPHFLPAHVRTALT